MADTIAELAGLIDAIQTEKRVTLQKTACDDIKEWLGKHWEVLLDPIAELIPACSDIKYSFAHPADQLLLEIVTLFDKCKDARTAAQQQLPLSMARTVLFGNGLGKKESLLIFDKDAMQELFDLLATLLKSEKTHVDGANLLLEVLEVPGYREQVQLAWLVKMAHQCMDTTIDLVGKNIVENVEDKKLAYALLGIVQVIMRELCRDSGVKCTCDQHAVKRLATGFTNIGVQVQNHRTEDSTLVHIYMRALNEFHATFVLDHRECAEKLRPTVLQVVHCFWKSGGASLKKSFVQYLRLVVRAQMITANFQIEPIVSLLKEQVGKLAGNRNTDEKRGLLTYDETNTIELLVDLMHLQIRNLAKCHSNISVTIDEDDNGDGRKSKRQRPSSHPADLEWLVAAERMFPKRAPGCHPRWYMQVLFIYLVKYPDEIPSDMRTDLADNFGRAIEQRSFEDLDLIWAMRCLDELLMTSQQQNLSDKERGVWIRLFSSVLKIIDGRGSKRMESFEAVALNLLVTIVAEGAVSPKDIEDKQNMSTIWKLLVANCGQGTESQGRGPASVSSSMHTSQAKEKSAGRSVQDSLQVDVALTSFLVVVMTRVSLSDDSISVEGLTCCRNELLKMLLRKAVRGQNATGHQSVNRLILTAHLIAASIGSGQGAPQQVECSCCVWKMRDMVSETRRAGDDIFRDLDGKFLDVYTRVRGRSGPDFTFLGDSARQESTGARYRKTPRVGDVEDCKFERSITSIGMVTGWCNQVGPLAQSDNASHKRLVPVQTPQEEVRLLSTTCLDLLLRFDREYSEHDTPPPVAIPPHSILALFILDAATSAPVLDREWATSVYDFLFEHDALLKHVENIFQKWDNIRSMAEKVAILESLEDVIDSIVRILARQTTLNQLGVSPCEKMEKVLNCVSWRCKEEMLGSRAAQNQSADDMDVEGEDDFAAPRHEQQATMVYKKIRFRVWVKISAATEDAQEPNPATLKEIFDIGHPLDETLERLNVLCNFGVPVRGEWKYTVDLIKIAANRLDKQVELKKSDRELRYLRIVSFLVERLGQQGVQMVIETKKAFLQSVQRHVLKWNVDEAYNTSKLKKGLAKAPRILRQMCVGCVAKVVPLAVECYGTKESRALGEFMSASLNDVAFDVRFEAAKGLGSAIRAFATRTTNVGIFKDVLERLKTLHSMYQTSLLSAEANIRTKVLIFGEIAALDDEYASMDVQAYCITRLCTIFAEEPDSEDVVRSVLDKVARCQHFPDSTELVRAHMPSILCHWWSQRNIDQHVPWTDFPKELAGYLDQTAFVEFCVAPSLVPEILLHLESDERDKELQKIGDILYRSPIDKVVGHFYAHIYSRVVPLAYARAGTDAGNVEGEYQVMLQRAFRYIESCKEARSKTPKILVTLRLLDVVLNGNPILWDPENENTHWIPSQTAKIVGVALAEYASKQRELFWLGIKPTKTKNPDAASQSLIASQSLTAPASGGIEEPRPTDFLPQVYLHLLRALKGTQGAHGGRKVTRQQKERVMITVGVVVEGLGRLLKERIDEYPWVLNHTISQLLTAIRDRDVARQGCEILKNVIDGVISADKSAFLVEALGDIICTLIPQAAHYATTDHAAVIPVHTPVQGTIKAPNLPLEIIETLVSDAVQRGSAKEMERIRGLPPFPKDHIFDKIRRICSTKLTNDGVRQDEINVLLKVFEDLKEPVPFEVQKATLLHLHEQLREHFATALCPPMHQHGRRRLVDACIYKLLAWTKMADTYVKNDRHNLLELIGKCLGQLGPSLTKALAENTPMERVVAKSPSKTAAKGGVDQFLRRYRIEMCITIIKKLRSYLEDDNVKVVEEAVKLLKGVFHCTEKQDILKTLAELNRKTDENLDTGEKNCSSKRSSGGSNGVAAGNTVPTNDVKNYLEPFLNKCTESASSGVSLAGVSLKRNKTAGAPCRDDEREHWATKDSAGCTKKYEAWLHNLSHSMCKMNKSHDLWPLCAQMCTLKVDFAELLFPSLLFSMFFSSFEEDNMDEVARELGEMLTSCIFCEGNTNVKAIRLVLQGLEVLRLVKQTIFKDHFMSTDPAATHIKEWKYSYFFHVPYIDVAKAARRCGAHLTALMYMELHSDAWSREPNVKKEGNRELLLAYRAVEEPDGLDAFNKWRDFRSRFITWEHNGECAKTVGVFDNLLDFGASSSGGMGSAMDLCLQRPVEHGLCGALHNIGFSQLSFMAAASFAAPSSVQHASYDEDVFFESAWRAQAWQQANTVVRPQGQGARSGYHANIFSALTALADVQQERSRTYADVADLVRRNIECARSTAMADFQDDHDSQSTTHSQSQLVRLQMCEDIQSFSQELVEKICPVSSSPSQSRSAFATSSRADIGSKNYMPVLKRMRNIWHMRYKEFDYNFTLCEPLISLHTILLGISPCSKLLETHLCLAAKISMKQGNMSFARSSMQKLQMWAASHNGGKVLVDPSSWWIREAKVLWRDEQVGKAADLMGELDRHLCEYDDLPPQDRLLQSRALAMNAALSSVTDSSATVTEMLERCVQLREGLNQGHGGSAASNDYRRKAAKSHLKLAAFNDQMFTHIQGQHLENQQQKKLLEQTKKMQKGVQFKGSSLHKKSLDLLEQNYSKIRKQRAVYLRAALDHYMHCIALDAGEGKYQGAIYRILHLWFGQLEESSLDGEPDPRKEVSELLLKRFKETNDLSVFTSVARQVLSRLDERETERQVQQPMRVLLAKLLQQRPQELLLPTFYIGTLEGKKNAAKALIDHLRKQADFAEIVTQTAQLKDAYIELAKSRWAVALGHIPEKCTVSTNCKKCVSTGAKAELKKFTTTSQNRAGKLSGINFRRTEPKVRVPTVAAPADPGDAEICVVSFGPNVDYPGGVTFPKKIVCIASNGQHYTQIVKSEDPRGDVVLSQIFSLVNVHLARDAKCRQRQLELGTYNVVALGEKSCVLEFVDNAAPLGNILGSSTNKETYNKSLHGRFGPPGSWTYFQSFKAIEQGHADDDAAGNGSTTAQLAAYNKVCKHMPPVFRHYFAESTRSAPEWFELRLKYARSVAVSSMAGHIVGLGDRHCSNILIRETGRQRGSLVHIDLGIIFDQARHLPRPEQIPFRLTRDLVDGMGLAGTDGVMTRCSQESLRVMRENKYALLAIVDVLLHDPLESWKISNEKRQQKGDDNEGEESFSNIEGQDSVSNIDARIIRKTIKDKLEGLVCGELLGVQGQVKQLISEATSPNNLSLLFQGWGAWY